MARKKKISVRKQPAHGRRRRPLKKAAVSYSLIEAEINRLNELLQTVKQKSALVRRSLAYIEREQRKVKKQMIHARAFLMRLKNRGMKAIQNFPQNAEDIYDQLKSEFNRLSKRWIS